jgi:hypothetical protein
MVGRDLRIQSKLGVYSVTLPDSNSPSAGVSSVATLFALCGVYLAVLAVLMFALPGAIPMSAGAPLLFGLELAGPYMFLLMALVAGAVAWGLMRRNNITRHVAMLIAIAGVVMLVPSVSSATVMTNLRALTFGGLGIIVRVIVAWYLGRKDVAEQFRKPS